MSKAVPTKTLPTAKKPRGRFLHEVVLELKKVKWPSREDVWQLTGVVIVTIAAVGLYVFVLDVVFGKFLHLIGMYGPGR